MITAPQQSKRVSRNAVIQQQTAFTQVITADDMLMHVSRLVREWTAQPGNNYSLLSKRCDGVPGITTISKIASRETQHPRLSTVARLYGAMGYQVCAVRL